uniref:Uncharacterized protein n=1 Tax=Tanacetum cinerariifolium TaxID=118510 RepID=A0A6L2JUT3_TANCI|nr:hypothetical protein [Tanacetum cinerariifolium]
MDSNFNNENEPWKFSLDIDDSELHLTPVVRPSSSTHVEPSPYTPNPVRIIPGHAGIIQQAKMLKKKGFGTLLTCYFVIMDARKDDSLPSLTKYDYAKTVCDHLPRRDSQHLVQFLVALRHDFEGLRGSVLHRDPLPSVDFKAVNIASKLDLTILIRSYNLDLAKTKTILGEIAILTALVDHVVSELLVEEIRLNSHDDKKIFGPSIFASTHHTTTSTRTQNMPYSKLVLDECAYCKHNSHWKS